MSAHAIAPGPPVSQLWGELRYGRELARLLADPLLRQPRARAAAPPVLLIPGFMAGDRSLAVLRGWLRRRGHHVTMSGMRINVDCAGRATSHLEDRVTRLAHDCGGPVFLIGQSRGGALARVLAVRQPESVCGVAMLGSPVREPLAVSDQVLATVRLVALLGDMGVPGVFTSECRDGTCCAAFKQQLTLPFADHITAVAVHSRSDGIVDWRACLDPHAERVEVDSSHCGMSVHADVYRVLAGALDGPPGPAG